MWLNENRYQHGCRTSEREIVKATAEATKERDSLGCAKLVIFCNAPDDNPFMAGAFLGVTEADAVINVGVSGPEW